VRQAVKIWIGICYYSFESIKYWYKKDMDVNEHERISNVALKNKLK
jgi:hypothetical protein